MPRRAEVQKTGSSNYQITLFFLVIIVFFTLWKFFLVFLGFLVFWWTYIFYLEIKQSEKKKFSYLNV